MTLSNDTRHNDTLRDNQHYETHDTRHIDTHKNNTRH